jgi:ribosomal-protein-serine acetyltransferase
MRVRTYQPDDHAEWLRMRCALWPHHDALDVEAADMAQWLARPDATVVVAARPEGGLAGFAEIGGRSYADGCDSHPVAYLEGWYVDEDARRRGVGAALVAAAEAWAREHGFHEMASDALLDNELSHRAHAALGFEEVDRVVQYRKALVDDADRSAADAEDAAAAGFRTLHVGPLTLRLIEPEMLPELLAAVASDADAEELEYELRNSYLPEFDSEGRRMKYGFAAERGGVVVGFSLLGVDDWHEALGYTGADTLAAFRGQGIAPASKPALFRLGFEILGLNRIETGCAVSNASSKRSIEKTPGFVYEGIQRERERRRDGSFEDVHFYAILRRDWERLYDPAEVRIAG